MGYCRCLMVCFFVTLSYALPTIMKKNAAENDNTGGKNVEWSHLIKKRSANDVDDDGVSLNRPRPETSENSRQQGDNAESSAAAAQPNDFDWQLLQSTSNELANEIRRRRRRSSHFSKDAQQQKRFRSKRAPPSRLAPFLGAAPSPGDETAPVERWGSEQNIAFDGDEMAPQPPSPPLTLGNNNQVQLTENDLKKLANLIETMQHLNEEGYGAEGRSSSPQRDSPYIDDIEWDENPDIEEEMDESTMRQLLAAYRKMRTENVAQGVKNAGWINYPTNYPKRNLRKRSYNAPPPTNYYGYDVLDDADSPASRSGGPIRIRIPPEYVDVVDDQAANQRYRFAAPGRNLILIDAASLNDYLPNGGTNDGLMSSGGPAATAAIDPDRLESEMTLERKIFDLANQMRAKYRKRR